LRVDAAPHEHEVFEDAGHNHGVILDRLGDRNWEFYRAALNAK
jgi:hypothetical protein